MTFPEMAAGLSESFATRLLRREAYSIESCCQMREFGKIHLEKNSLEKYNLEIFATMIFRRGGGPTKLTAAVSSNEKVWKIHLG